MTIILIQSSKVIYIYMLPYEPFSLILSYAQYWLNTEALVQTADS